MDLAAGLIDVFADMALTGNPLAVVEGADGLDDITLRRIAREFNQAETSFLMKSGRADWRLRSFTASGAEVFGAGHNALGAWLWLAQDGQLGPLSAPKTFRQEIGEDILPITLETRDGRIFGRMKQAPMRLLSPLSATCALMEALGLMPDDLMGTPPPRAVDTGAAHLMVRLKDKGAVDRAEPSAAHLLKVLKNAGAEGCYVYAFDLVSATAYARFFNPTVGLWEDSGTGTAAGPLCAYLGSENLLPGKTLVIEKGTRMGRTSLLRVTLTPEPELTGTGVVVLRGTLRI